MLCFRHAFMFWRFGARCAGPEFESRCPGKWFSGGGHPLRCAVSVRKCEASVAIRIRYRWEIVHENPISTVPRRGGNRSQMHKNEFSSFTLIEGWSLLSSDCGFVREAEDTNWNWAIPKGGKFSQCSRLSFTTTPDNLWSKPQCG